jgi:hypothetical protein
MKLMDYINVWNNVTIEKRPNDNHRVYGDKARELRAIVGDKPTILWLSGSNGGLFGSGSFLAVDETGEVIGEILCLIE